MTTLSQAQAVSPLDEIESTLKTKAVDILSTCLGALSGLDRGAAYQAVMNEPAVLDEAFSLLRRDPQLFSEVIVGSEGEVAEILDDTTLRCGETLGYIKTLVVRASARRHFRRALGGPRMVTVPNKKKPGLLDRMMVAVGLKNPPRPKRRRVPGRGDKLYLAIKPHLLYDWQARLIPHYAELTPETVGELKDSLLTICEPAELRFLAGAEGRDTLKRKRRPLFLCDARQMMRGGADTIDPDILWKLWDQMNLVRLFDDTDISETRKVIAEVAATSKLAIGQLMPILGRDVRLFVTFLFFAYQHLGRTVFRNIFLESGSTTWMCQTFAERLAKLESLPQPELTEMVAVFTQVTTGGNKPNPAQPSQPSES